MSGWAATTMRRAALLPLKSWIRTSDEEPGAPVRKSVAGNVCSDGVLERHPLHGGGEPQRLVLVQDRGGAVGDRAVRTVARAHVAQDHERGGAVLPALTDVGAMGLLAHGVKPVVAHQLLQGDVIGPAGSGDLEPRRLAIDGMKDRKSVVSGKRVDLGGCRII